MALGCAGAGAVGATALGCAGADVVGAATLDCAEVSLPKLDCDNVCCSLLEPGVAATIIGGAISGKAG
ncbi:MAG: hypothetical protein LBT70_03660 [Holosporaceae bacterium]|nr:hypothetical protein [Holosporaceae bacterium]